MKIRLVTTKKNPLGLEIGDRVWAENVSTFEYVDHNTKSLQKEDAGFFCTVCGVQRKAEGSYSPGSSGYFGEGSEPPEFTATKWHWVYVCRKTISGKPFFVHPEDLIME